MIRADIETAVSPIVGNEKQSEDMVNYLLQEFEGDTSKIWQSNIFGRSFHELVNEDLQNKLHRMPEDARKKLQETLTRIINEGSGGSLTGYAGGVAKKQFLLELEGVDMTALYVPKKGTAL